MDGKWNITGNKSMLKEIFNEINKKNDLSTLFETVQSDISEHYSVLSKLEEVGPVEGVGNPSAESPPTEF